jgi:hypothetical protein
MAVGKLVRKLRLPVGNPVGKCLLTGEKVNGLWDCPLGRLMDTPVRSHWEGEPNHWEGRWAVGRSERPGHPAPPGRSLWEGEPNHWEGRWAVGRSERPGHPAPPGQAIQFHLVPDLQKELVLVKIHAHLTTITAHKSANNTAYYRHTIVGHMFKLYPCEV